MNLDHLRQFLLKANAAGYATGQERAWKKESDGSTTIVYSEGLWRMHDNFFGGEPYGGRIVVFHREKPVWMMVYYGFIAPAIPAATIYPLLQEALRNMPKEAPFRGPRELGWEKYRYTNSWEGSLIRYSGKEKIYHSQDIVYEATYLGGLVDQANPE